MKYYSSCDSRINFYNAGAVMKRISLLLFCIWMLLIVWFSAQPADQSKIMSGRVTTVLVDLVTSVLPVAQSGHEQKLLVHQMHNLIRKAAHAANYFILGCLAYQAFYLNIRIRRSGWLVAGAIAFCILFASLDELHQTYVPGRSGELRDVLLDSASALVGILVCWSCCRQRLFGRKAE